MQVNPSMSPPQSMTIVSRPFPRTSKDWMSTPTGRLPSARDHRLAARSSPQERGRVESGIQSSSMDTSAESAGFPVPPTEDEALAELIARMAKGDETALEALYEITLGKVYGLALRITGQAAAAEDVVAEVYYQAWRQAERFDRQRGHPLSWLLTLCRSRALDSLRRRDEASSHPEPETLTDPVPAERSDPVDLLLAVERQSALHLALDTLNPLQRQLLALAFYRDLSHQEIARHTGLPLGSVKTYIRKAMLSLQAVLSTEGVTP